MTKLNKNEKELKIMVVDDSDFSRKQIVNYLIQQKYNVVAEVNSARQAFESLNGADPNVMIIDVVMPDTNGIELTRQVRENFDISIILISSLHLEHIVLDGIGAGASDFLKKPFTENKLIDVLNKIESNLREE